VSRISKLSLSSPRQIQGSVPQPVLPETWLICSKHVTVLHVLRTSGKPDSATRRGKNINTLALSPRSFRHRSSHLRVCFFKLSPKAVQLGETRKTNSTKKIEEKTEIESEGRKKIETGGWETKNYKVHTPSSASQVRNPDAAAKAASLRREGIQAHSHRQRQRSLIKSNQPPLPPPRFLLQSSQV